MSKRSIEVTVLSARGLKRSNPLWKLQTLCVAWIDPEHKYCSKIDKQNDTHPVWNVNFSSIVDADADFSEAALTIQVHSREPLFYLSKLECSATVLLKEFVAMADKAGGHCSETASFQLRSPSGKPRGIVDVCIRIGHKFQSYTASPATDVTDRDSSNGVDPDEEENEEEEEEKEEPVTAYPASLPASRLPSGRPEDFPPPNYPYSYPPKIPAVGNPPAYRPPPPWPPGGAPYSAAAAAAAGAPYGPRPYGGGPYGYSNYPPPQAVLGGNNYFGLPGGRPNYGGGGPQRPGLGLAAGAMAGGLAGGMLFGLDGLENGLNDALSSQFHGGSVSVYGDSLF